MQYLCPACQRRIDTRQKDVSSGICPDCGTRFPGQFAGRFVRDFQVIGELGRGANGIVYLAQQPLIAREIALKLILNEHLDDDEVLSQLFMEARAAARLSHPNIVQALSAGVDQDNVCYYAMELLEGQNVEYLLDQFGALEFSDALFIGTRIAGALAYAWRRTQLVHGDIKPANIMIDSHSGEPKLADLGQAHFGSDKLEIDSLVATPLYVAPELVRGEYEKIGPKTDIYSFGATLYEMFAGEPPFFSEDTDEVLKMQTEAPLIPLADRFSFFDPQLSDFVGQMLAKDPELRPSTWNQVAEGLRKVELRLQTKNA